MKIKFIGVLVIVLVNLQSCVIAFEKITEYTDPLSTVSAVYMSALKDMEGSAQMFYLEKKPEKITVSLITPDKLFASLSISIFKDGALSKAKIMLNKDDDRIIQFVMKALDQSISALHEKPVEKIEKPIVVPVTPEKVAVKEEIPAQPVTPVTAPVKSVEEEVPVLTAVAPSPAQVPETPVIEPKQKAELPDPKIVQEKLQKPKSEPVDVFADSYRRAYAAYTAKDYKKAVSLYKKAHTVKPENIDAKIWLLKSLMKAIPTIKRSDELESAYKDMNIAFTNIDMDTMEKSAYVSIKQDYSALKKKKMQLMKELP